MQSNGDPLISIVIPTYNRARQIYPTIKSVLAQTVSNWELIIVDDFSGDVAELRNLVGDIDDSRVRLIEHDRNRHGSAARNTGIKAAKGRYTALLDSDDLWLPHKLQVCLDAGGKEKDVFYSQFKREGKTLPERAKRREESIGDYLLANGGHMQTSTLFLSTDFARKVLFDEALPRFQDFDFCIRLEHAGAEFRFVNQSLVTMTDVAAGQRISNSVDVAPALFWLDRVKQHLSANALTAFYLNRVVRYLVLSRRQREVFAFMPIEVLSQLTFKQRIKLELIKRLPSSAIPLVRRMYKAFKR